VVKDTSASKEQSLATKTEAQKDELFLDGMCLCGQLVFQIYLNIDPDFLLGSPLIEDLDHIVRNYASEKLKNRSISNLGPRIMMRPITFASAN